MKAEYVAGDDCAVMSAWDRFYDSCPDISFVASREFADFVAGVFGAPNLPGAVVVRQSGELLALMPTAVRIGRVGPFLLRKLEYRNGWHSYYGDCLVTERDSAIENYLLNWTVESFAAWDEVDLWRSHFPPGDNHHDAIPAPIVNLEDWPSPAQPKRVKKDRKRTERMLADPDFTMRVVSDPIEVAGHAHIFTTMHTALKREQAQWSLFDELAGAAARFPGALQRMAGAGKASILAIEHRHSPVAMKVVFHDRGDMVDWRTAWVTGYRRHAPGIALNDLLVEWGQERGVRRIHLGPGTESYKLRHATAVPLVFRRRAVRRSPATLLRRLLRR